MSDFSNDIAINKYKLDEELVQQPQKFYEWAKAEVIAGEKVSELKDDLEVIKAEMEIRIRRNPTLYDLPNNPKEGLIKAAVLIQRKVKKASKRLIKAQRTHGLLKKAEKSFEHRKKSLEGLVSVNMQLHFATPKNVPRHDFETESTRGELLDRARKKKRKIKRR
jgi:hypothetical protein